MQLSEVVSGFGLPFALAGLFLPHSSLQQGPANSQQCGKRRRTNEPRWSWVAFGWGLRTREAHGVVGSLVYALGSIIIDH